MPNSNIPVGLNYVDVRRRAGVLSSYEMVVSKGMCLTDFYLIDDWLQVQVKNFGQIGVTFKSEVYILKCLQSKSDFECCESFSIVPITKNGIPYTGDEIEIDFDLIVSILPTGRHALIYASTNPIQKQIPDIYEVGFSVTELWEYIYSCSCPSE
jgi:hypothetical protein